MKRSTFFAAAIASFAFFAPLQSEAARCKLGSVYRPSVGVCVSKTSAIRAGIYRPRVAKASIRHRMKKHRAPIGRRVMLARAHPAETRVPPRSFKILPDVPAIDPREFLNLQLRAWVDRNRSELVQRLEAIQ